jgi:hypothetical protein
MQTIPFGRLFRKLFYSFGGLITHPDQFCRHFKFLVCTIKD